MATRKLPSESGFTMIELVVVMVITGIMAGAIGGFIRQPMVHYRRNMIRAELVADADRVFGRIARDIQRALPNSVRVGAGGTSLEILNVQAGARYRAYFAPAVTDLNTVLTFDGDSAFNVLDEFDGEPLLDPAGGTIALDEAGGRDWHVAVYTTDTPTIYSNLAAPTGAGVITPSSTVVSITDTANTSEEQISLSTAFDFDWDPSETGRIYLVDTPIAYYCTAGTRNMTRAWHYAVNAANPPTTPVGTTSDMTNILDPTSGCSFTYQQGNSQRSGLVIARLRINSPTSAFSDRIELVQQIRVVNVP